MTDRTDFTKKPRTPAEKMREIEERVATLEARFESQWLDHDTHRHEIESGARFTSSALGPAAQPTHGEPSRLVEQRQSQFRVPLDDGVIGPGYHPLPAEPPGSPTVVEAEDPFASQREAYTELFRDVAEKAVESLRDQQRLECWEVRRHDGTVWIPGYRATKQESDRILSEGPYLASQHRMVELRDWEEIVHKGCAHKLNCAGYGGECDDLISARSRVKELESLIDSYEEMRDERDALKTQRYDERSGLTTEQWSEAIDLARRLVASGSRDKWLEAVEQHESVIAERDQLQTRVAEFENAARLVSAQLNEQRSVLDHVVDPLND